MVLDMKGRFVASLWSSMEAIQRGEIPTHIGYSNDVDYVGLRNSSFMAPLDFLVYNNP
jgi:hypothetical protein